MSRQSRPAGKTKISFLRHQDPPYQFCHLWLYACSYPGGTVSVTLFINTTSTVGMCCFRVTSNCGRRLDTKVSQEKTPEPFSDLNQWNRSTAEWAERPRKHTYEQESNYIFVKKALNWDWQVCSVWCKEMQADQNACRIFLSRCIKSWFADKPSEYRHWLSVSFGILQKDLTC